MKQVKSSKLRKKSKVIPVRLPQQLAHLGPQFEYTITLDEKRLLGCMTSRAFPFVLRRKGSAAPVQYAKSYEGAVKWIVNNNGILVKEKQHGKRRT